MSAKDKYSDEAHKGTSPRSFGTFSLLIRDFHIGASGICRPSNDNSPPVERLFVGRQMKLKVQFGNSKTLCKDTKYESEMQENCEVFYFANIFLHKIIDITLDYIRSCPVPFATSASPCRP